MNRTNEVALLLLAALVALGFWLWLLAVTGLELERRRSVQVARDPRCRFSGCRLGP